MNKNITAFHPVDPSTKVSITPSYLSEDDHIRKFKFLFYIPDDIWWIIADSFITTGRGEAV